MAALVAARRTDIACLVTIASPLDTDGWTDRIGVSRLSASLNPVDFADRLRALPQSHLRGLKDEVVPPSVADRYLARVPNAAVIDREAFDHACCWERHWRELRGLTCLAR